MVQTIVLYEEYKGMWQLKRSNCAVSAHLISGTRSFTFSFVDRLTGPDGCTDGGVKDGCEARDKREQRNPEAKR